jgi:hypothetical protein
MSENPEKQTESKRSFVSEKDASHEETPNTSPITTIKVEGKEVHLLKPDVALTLIYGRLSEIKDEMKMLNSVFSKASQPQSFQSPAASQQPVQAKAPEAPKTENPPEVNPLQMPPKLAEQTPRVKEILVALAPVADLLKIDTETSSMLVLVKPASFLGPENFAKVAAIIRAIGGQYVSAGKNSHFEISKAPLRK